MISWVIDIMMWASFIYLAGIFAKVNLTFVDWSPRVSNPGDWAHILFLLPLLLFALQSAE